MSGVINDPNVFQDPRFPECPVDHFVLHLNDALGCKCAELYAMLLCIEELPEDAGDEAIAQFEADKVLKESLMARIEMVKRRYVPLNEQSSADTETRKDRTNKKRQADRDLKSVWQKVEKEVGDPEEQILNSSNQEKEKQDDRKE